MRGKQTKKPYRMLVTAWHYVRYGWPTMALVFVIACGGYYLMHDTAKDQDRAYIESTRNFVRESISAIGRDNTSVTTEYALWTDTYENTTLADNQKWMEDNFFSTNASVMSIYRSGVGIRFSYVEDDDAKLRATIPKIIPSLRTDDFRAYVQNPIEKNLVVPKTSLVVLNGTLFSLALQPIRPYANYTGIRPIPGSPVDYVVALKAIDQKAVDKLGTSFTLIKPNLKVGSEKVPANNDRISFTVEDAAGRTLAVMSWDNLRPGTTAMKARLGPASLALLLIMMWTIITTQQSVSARLRLFKAARVAAETANQVKSNFLASVSHELRTPLSGIIGYAEMIEEDALDAGNTVMARDAKKVTNSAQHLLSVINDLLDHTKIEAGKMDLNPTKIDVVPIFRSVVENLQHQVIKKHTTLTLTCDPQLGEAILDGMRLKQCLFNLVSNAAKFTRDGKILVAARLVDLHGVVFLRASVKDNGIGMSEETLAKLFLPFVQADEGTAATFGGTGLGLVITKALIEAMGGTIHVESTLGEGSTFTILVPRGLALPLHAPTADAIDTIAA